MRLPIVIATLTFAFACANLSRPACAQQDLDSLRTQWAQLDTKMKATYESLDSGDTTPGLADDYRDMVDEANSLIKQMRAIGRDALQKQPVSSETIRTLIGIMVHDVKKGNDREPLALGDAMIAANINPLWFEKAAALDRLELNEKRVFEELVIRQKEAAADNNPRVKIETTKGDIVIELFENQAPNTVANFITLVEAGQYSNKLFHRVIEGFVAETGSQEIDGIESDPPGYVIPSECFRPDTRRHFSGSVSLANAGPDTGCRQFFITFERAEDLDKRRTVFGRVISGDLVLERIERTAIRLDKREQPIANVRKDRIKSAKVLRKRDHIYRPRKVGEPEPTPEKVEKEAMKKESKEKEKQPGDSETETSKDSSDTEMKEDSESADNTEDKSQSAENEKENEEPETEEPETEEPETEEPETEEPETEEPPAIE